MITDARPRVNPLLDRWNAFFFAEGDARTLGIVRVLLAATILALSFVDQAQFPLWALVRPWVWSPVPAFQSWPTFGPASELALAAILWTWRGALLLTVIGLFTRPASIVAAVLGFIVLGLPQNFAKVNHHHGLAAICLIILALSRAGDAWSLDRLRMVARRARGPFAPDAPDVGGEYRWPLALMQVMAVLVLFSAGIAKVRSPGIAGWIMTDNLYYTMIRHFYTHRPPISVGLWLTQWPLLCKLLAAGALGLELTSPLVLVLRGRWRLLFLAMLAGMMLGFGLILGVLFLHFILILLIVFLPWQGIGARVAATMPVRHFTIIFDGSCGICRQTMAVISGLDLLHRVEIRDAIGEWPQLAVRFPGLSQGRCLDTMHVVRQDGRVYEGFDGYRALAWALPLWWVLVPLLYVPGVPLVGRAIYAHVARERFVAGCPVPDTMVTRKK